VGQARLHRVHPRLRRPFPPVVLACPDGFVDVHAAALGEQLSPALAHPQEQVGVRGPRPVLAETLTACGFHRREVDAVVPVTGDILGRQDLDGLEELDVSLEPGELDPPGRTGLRT